MSRSFLIRQSFLFWQESVLAAVLLMLIGWLPSLPGSVAGFACGATVLLALGLWLYEGGGRHIMLHFLLYPLVIAAGVLVYYLFGSLLLAALAAALFFWRVHALSTLTYTRATLQRLFVIALCISLFHLAILALFGSMMKDAVYDAKQLSPVLVLILGGYLLSSIGEYLTRQDTKGAFPPSAYAASLGGQLLGSRLLLALGYTAVTGLLLLVLSFLWGVAKKPLGDALYWLFGPALRAAGNLIEQLAGALGNNQRVNDLMNESTEATDELPLDEMEFAGEPLFSLWEPYLIGGIVVVVAASVGWAIWKRRRRTASLNAADIPVQAETALQELTDEGANEGRPIWNLDELRKKTAGPEEDPVRYSYYRFLLHMADAGLRIEPFETSQEYLRRLRREWPHPDALELAGRITRYYEQYRYLEKPLSSEELADLRDCVETIQKTME
ncbi:DUF4129 domain-containing protein [Brevibacillus borstelensis]|uniref:DUF4129 domain-containing protein n=1 Tax=Brevibacillus borstelensis TaxID=45462 RepID=UPI0004F31274|nr:DUF4129 domain-containing protein [Brevibacillus borstelensis]KKX54930.1 hypothetical protein X546_12045 [Brevibacillus borstelensis cifa_chp40]